MMKIGITGSIASGKTTASKILCKKNTPLFSADKIVKKIYKDKKFKKLVSKNFGIKENSNFKKKLKSIILNNKIKFNKLEKLVHPLVRKEMNKFSQFYRNKRFLFYEIPLLVENKLIKKFDLVIFIRANKKIRLKRFKLKGGDIKLFNFLNSKQLPDKKKIKFCDHVIVNEKNLNILKKKLLNIMQIYV
jgi:dephospho-CoA kinase